MDIQIQNILEDIVMVKLMGSDEVRKRIENIYYGDEVKFKEIAMNIQLNSIFAHGLKVQDKWNLVRIKSVMEGKYGNIDKGIGQDRVDFLTELIKIEHKRIYDFVVTNPNFNIRLFEDFMVKRIVQTRSTTHEALTDMYIFLHLLINGGDVNVKHAVENILFENLLIKTNDYEASFNYIYDNMPEEQKNEALQYLEQLTGKRWRNNEAIFVDDIFASIEQKVLKDNPAISRRISQTGNSRISYHIRPLAYLRHAMAFVQMHGHDNHYFFDEVKITKREWIKLYGVYSFDDVKRLTVEERDVVMMYSLMLFAMHKNYNSLESDFWNVAFKKDNKEIELAEKELQIKITQFEKEKEKNQIENEKILEENEQLKALLKEMELKHAKEISRLEKQIETLESENQTVKSLETALFVNEGIDEEFMDVSVDDLSKLKDKFTDKKVVLVGGHDGFRKKFSDEFKNAFILSPDELHLGEQQIKTADFIVFETSYNNHAQFQRVKKFMQPQQKMLFVNQAKSLNVLANQLLKQL